MDNDRISHPLPLPLAPLFGTFHTAFFVLTLVFLLYLSGNLGAILGSLNTLAGFALFLLLWGIAAWSTGKALDGIIGKDRREAALFEGGLKFGRALLLAMLWGGVTGALFAGVILLTEAIFALGILLYGLVILPVAFLLGALVGLLLALLDGLLLYAVRKV